MVVNPLRGDAAQYYAYAWNLAHHGLFSGAAPGAAVPVADSFRDPGYPLLLAAWMKLLGTGAYWYAAVLWCQALLGAWAVALAMAIGKRWLPLPWLLAAGVLMAIWPHSVTFTGDLLTETLVGFLCVLALWLCLRATERASVATALGAGLAFGAAALTNAVLLPFGAGLALYLLWRRRLPRRVGLALLGAALLLPAAWAVRNAQLPPAPSGHSSTDRALLNLVQGSWPGYHAAYQAMVRGDVDGRRTLDAINAESRLLQTAPAQGIQHIARRLGQHPWRYLAWYGVEKAPLLWGWRIRMGQNDIYVYPTAHSPFDHQPAMRALVALCHTLNPLLAALMLLCLLQVTWRRWRTRATTPTPPEPIALQACLLLVGFITLVYVAL